MEMEDRFEKVVVGNCVKCFRKAKKDPQGEKSFADLQDNTYKSQGQKQTPHGTKEIKVNELFGLVLGKCIYNSCS